MVGKATRHKRDEVVFRALKGLKRAKKAYISSGATFAFHTAGTTRFTTDYKEQP